ncbi:type II toxin-antitoxin system RelE/ParE family toxin [Jannaschia donghaensis]|uniref:Uncharacterized protein n=1 Tax=Jannaschia donghaensis TaxID=420998 RepID=A0A0M6YGH0_9RHOB|nr:type II toxin-antitoxin system RelE/ParE family toxin [Jannaschia donghaensis]CTQ49448.1 hypothetical protein JDO7802_01462 [Jannaschia donghaensis]
MVGTVDHITKMTEGDYDAAFRRLNEVDTLLRSVLENRTFRAHLRGKLDNWLVRHGGSGQRLKGVFQPDLGDDVIYLAMVAFGGRDWMKAAVGRRAFGAWPSSLSAFLQRHGAESGGGDGSRRTLP